MKKLIAHSAAGLLAAGLLVGVSAAPSSALNDDSSWGRIVSPTKQVKPKPAVVKSPKRAVKAAR